MTGPITPDDVPKEKAARFPKEVFEAFNSEIIRNFNGGSATVKQPDVVDLLELAGISQTEIFANGYLNIEDVYREVGWKVTYDKPGYNESYPPTFCFKRKD